MNPFPIDQNAWERGLTVSAFLAVLTSHKDAMERRIREVRLNQAERDLFASLKQPLKMLIMTEEWCSDCLMNLPILVRIAEAAPHMQTRIFIRREWPQLRAYYTSQDIPSIPVVTFLNESFQPVGSWIERPHAAHERLTAWKKAHPEVEQTRRRFDLSAEQKREMLKEVLDNLLVEMEDWYNQGLQSETVREVAEILGLLQQEKHTPKNTD